MKTNHTKRRKKAATVDVGAVHPGRYPKHKDPEKGQVHGGECNRTDCKDHGAVFWNRVTHAFYCAPDAHQINYRNTLCVRLDQKPESVEAMNAMNAEVDVSAA